MGKKRTLKLTVPNPCSENWDKMTLTDKGRFCKRCCNIITDFSLFTDRELVEYLSGIKGKVCGRFDNSQLNRIIAIHEPANTPIFRRVLLSTALAAGIAGTTHSQSAVTPNMNGANSSGIVNPGNTSLPDKPAPTEASNVLKGIIKDKKTGQPIPNAEMLMQFDSVNTALFYSDSTGHFSLAIPDNYLNKKITLETLVYGYIERNIIFDVKKFNKQISIKLEKSKEDTSKTVGFMMM
jgi:hypothetical protein